MTPGRALTYSFAGTPPIPVLTSRTTIAQTDSHSTAGPSTQISWSGAFDVLGDGDRRTVEHINCDIVWPATLGALAAAVGAGHSPGTQVPPLGKAAATP